MKVTFRLLLLLFNMQTKPHLRTPPILEPKMKSVKELAPSPPIPSLLNLPAPVEDSQ